MMITIHGLPVNTKYQDLKVLIKQECNINDFILDCLVNENDGTKKVRVGLADDSEGSHLIKCLNGYRMSGNILRLNPVGKSAPMNVPQQNAFETRGNYQARNDYSSQGFNERNNSRIADAARPTPWATNNQWAPNQPVQTQLPSSYNYQQQPSINTYGPQTNPPIKPQFESRDAVATGHGSQHPPPYRYNPKINLINLGPQRSIPTTLREIPVASRPVPASSRYQDQNYGMQTEKPITIMKDNFQGPNQYNIAATHSQGSGNYAMQNQPPVWASQQQLKPLEKPSTIEKKLYDERKYSQANQNKSISNTMVKSEDPYKGYDKDRQFSPQRRPYGRDMAPERRNSPSDRDIPHASRSIMSNRRSPMRRMSPPGRQTIYPDRRSPGRRVSPGNRSSPNRVPMILNRDISPNARRISPSARHVPLTGRRTSPSGSRFSPSRRCVSPPGRSMMASDRHISPHARRFSPSRQGHQIRQVSPDRKMSPLRKFSPSNRRSSPQMKKEEYSRGRRVSPPTHSPLDRRVASRSSPGRVIQRGMPSHTRKESPQRQGRYSPPRLHPDKAQDYQDARRAGNIKSVRPAYEPQIQASEESIYSGGYRHNREDVQYPVPRMDWQDRENFLSKIKNEDNLRDGLRIQKFDIQRVSDSQRTVEQESKRSRSRSSRSPRRERSPLRDRYRRHSPSPRSPRRSWALEKRRSPEIRDPPPPPIWPGQDGRDEYSHQNRSKIHDRQIEKHIPVWEPREKKRDDSLAAENRKKIEEELRIRSEVGKWTPIPQSSPQESSCRLDDKHRMQKESRFMRKDFENRHDYMREDNIRKSYSDRIDKEYQRQDLEDIRYKSALGRKDDVQHNREEYSGRIEEKKKKILQKQEQLQKKIDEVYKRAVDFTKKAEMYRKGEHKKELSYDSDRHRDEDQAIESYGQRFQPASYDERHNRNDLRKEYSKETYSKNDDVKNLSENIAQKPRFELDNAQKRQELSQAIKAKRNKAIDEISEKMLCKYGSSLPDDLKNEVHSELKCTLGRKLYELFGDKDVSFIEMVIKFNARHSQKDEENIFEEVVSSLPSSYRNMKRVAQDDSDIPAKTLRRPNEPAFYKEQQPRTLAPQIPDWNVGMMSLNIASNPGIFVNSPYMVPVPTQYQFVPTYQELPQPAFEEKKDGYSLYLCKDNFQPILEYEMDKLKEFLIKQLLKVTETCQGWAPDFTLSKQITTHRHEVVTRDGRSKDWLLNLDFSDFTDFNVLVYTTEELWYERAAIWLPGHSKCRNIDPLTKLKLQNKKLEGIDIGKWKYVKRIINDKGTRLYVDMPPSSARALEKFKMMLSYELQKVNVFLKAVAIDKNAFDAGLNEFSLPVLPLSASCPMPSLGQDPNIVKIAGKGNKPLTLATARKIKDIIIYSLFKYHQRNGNSSTDFVKYGFCQPGYLGILPENEESRKWVSSIDLGKVNRQYFVILGADENKTLYFKMNILTPRDYSVNTAMVYERLRHSNQGVKGLNFNLWKNQNIERNNAKVVFRVEMDLESVETISKMNYQLDYVADGQDIRSVPIEAECSWSEVKEIIDKYRAEMSDTYDVANMELASSGSEDEVICLN